MSGAPATVLAPTAAIPNFSDAVRHGDLVFVSGLVATGSDGVVVGPGVVEQTLQVFANLGEILDHYGADLGDVLHTRFFLLDVEDFAAVRATRNEIYGPAICPAAAMVVAAGLVVPDARLELEVVVGL